MFDVKLIQKYEIKRENSLQLLEKELYDEIFYNLTDLIKFKPKNALIIDTKTNYLSKKCDEANIENVIYNNYSIYEGNIMNIDKTFHLVFSINNMHKINNIRQYLIQIYNKMNEGAVFFGSFLGNDNLIELSQAFFESYMQNGNDFINHFLPIIDIKMAGSLIQSCGFKSIVTCIEKKSIKYDSIFEALHEIRKIGESNCMVKKIHTPITKSIISMADEIFKKHNKVTYSIISVFAVK